MVIDTCRAAVRLSQAEVGGSDQDRSLMLINVLLDLELDSGVCQAG